jgi:hypothetical protein
MRKALSKEEIVRQMWAAGNTAATIASTLKALGHDYDRQKTIRLIGELGLPRARNGQHAPGGWKVQRKDLFAPEQYIPPRVSAPAETAKAVYALEEGDCRWPIGDPKKPGFKFCCRPSVLGLPYCEEHEKASVQPPERQLEPV